MTSLSINRPDDDRQWQRAVAQLAFAVAQLAFAVAQLTFE